LVPSLPPHALNGLNLFQPEEWQDSLPWQDFHPGVKICRLYGDGKTGPTAAVIRFSPGASIPAHCHTGYEHILVLTGSQVDEYGEVCAGALRIHPPGSGHAVTSPGGCLVLAIYEKPVELSA
jgi:anti-sigma factor ChrR (cupin superfamily)